jgi:preprotein translocase subunit SecF
MSFLRLSRLFVPVSVVLVLTSLVLLVTPSPRLSIEFTGGTLMEVQLPVGKTKADLEQTIATFKKDDKALDGTTISTTRTGSHFVRTTTLTNDEHNRLLTHLKTALGDVQELQYTTIGPTVGSSLKQRAFWALLAAGVAIIAFLAFAFRKIPKALSPWSFGLAAIAALVHDLAITVGIFTILSYVTPFQVDTLFVSALLSIMGYSVSDTIVIFDRIRDNMLADPRGDFAEIAERSLRQTLSRTLNTGLGALIMLSALFFFGSESIRWFMLALIIGTIIGTYSSFFVATPLLVYWRKRKGQSR